MVQSPKKFKVTPACRFHVATVGSDGQINANTGYSKPYRFKAYADKLVDAGYSDSKLRTVTVIIFE